MLRNSISVLVFISIISVTLTQVSQMQLAIGPFPNRLRVLQNYVDCASRGDILQVQIYNCPFQPCDFILGRTYNMVAYFKPATFHTAFDILIRLTVKDVKTTTLVIKHNRTLQVDEGAITTFSYPLKIKEELGQGQGNVQITVSQYNFTELCVGFSANVHY